MVWPKTTYAVIALAPHPGGPRLPHPAVGGLRALRPPPLQNRPTPPHGALGMPGVHWAPERRGWGDRYRRPPAAGGGGRPAALWAGGWRGRGGRHRPPWARWRPRWDRRSRGRRWPSCAWPTRPWSGPSAACRWNGGTTRAASPVSYTHLRAHETVLDLVCRLLLEKKHKQQKHIVVRIHDTKR